MIVLRLALFACVPVEEAPVPPNPLVEVGPERPACADPTVGFEGLAQEGLGHVQGSEQGRLTAGGAGVYAGDVDLDGDVDLVLGSANAGPTLLRNDGAGAFVEVKARGVSRPGQAQSAVVAVMADLDGDDLPDLVTAAPGGVVLHPNVGGRFGAPVTLWTSDFPYPIPGSLSLGDADGDGDLDLAIAGLEWLTSRCEAEGTCGEDLPNPGSPLMRLRNDGDGAWTPLEPLYLYDEPGYSVALTWTDREGDGDHDLLVLQDQGRNGRQEPPPAAFFRNDGGALVNDAEETHADLEISGMGLAVWDLNLDGTFDYCMSDTGPIHCLVSDGGTWYDAGMAMGLAPQGVPDVGRWSAWSVEMEDLDNDGLLDLAAAGGRPTGETDPAASFDDALFRGLPDGTFADETAAVGFGDARDHFGMAAADFTGDGVLDLVLATNWGEPSYWKGGCTAGAWTEVRLRGAYANTSGIGASVEVETATRRFRREQSSARALGQSLAPLHFGLGDDERVARVVVRWPDGAVTEATDPPARRLLTLFHPDRAPDVGR